MIKKTILLIAMFLTIHISQAVAESVKIASLNWGSYTGENLKDYGFHATIVRAAFKKVGKDVKFDFYPWERAYQTALKGEAFLISASTDEERRRIFFYSEPYDNAASYLIGLKEKNYKYDGNIQGLNKYTIGVLRGHYLVKMLQDAGVNNISEVALDVQNIRMLFANRIDFIAMSKIPAIAIIKNESFINGTLDQVVFYEPPLRDNPIHLIGHKDMPKSKEIVLEFNKGLKQIIKDGAYDSIVEKFGFK